MIENIVFCFAFALQIFAWILAGASVGFRSRREFKKAEAQSRENGKKPVPRYNTLFFRRLCLTVGAVAVCGYAVLWHDYVLLAGQAVLFAVLWFRVALVPEGKK